MTELAHLLEKDSKYAFERVDVFNTGGSPISRGYSALKVTQFRSHRTQGDLVSKFFRGPGELYEHPARPEFCSHSLKHFLPERMPHNFADVLPAAQAWVEGCCTGVRHVSEHEARCLQDVDSRGWVMPERAQEDKVEPQVEPPEDEEQGNAKSCAPTTDAQKPKGWAIAG